MINKIQSLVQMNGIWNSIYNKRLNSSFGTFNGNEDK